MDAGSWGALAAVAIRAFVLRCRNRASVNPTHPRPWNVVHPLNDACSASIGGRRHGIRRQHRTGDRGPTRVALSEPETGSAVPRRLTPHLAVASPPTDGATIPAPLPSSSISYPRFK